MDKLQHNINKRALRDGRRRSEKDRERATYMFRKMNKRRLTEYLQGVILGVSLQGAIDTNLP